MKAGQRYFIEQFFAGYTFCAFYCFKNPPYETRSPLSAFTIGPV
jgi:hypothetical protein